jgi:hypothetical protein
MATVKGVRPPSAGKGRPRGAVNKTTKAAREAFVLAFEGIGGVPALVAWAKKNPNQFFPLYARLMPIEHTGPEGGAIRTVVEHHYEK